MTLPLFSRNNGDFFHRGSHVCPLFAKFSLFYGIPILNLFLLTALFSATARCLIAVPSIPFELPHADYFSASQTSAFATLLTPPGNPTPILFFDDQSFNLNDDSECHALQSSMRLSRESFDWSDITLFADGSVSHAAIVRFAEEARKAGITRIFLAVSSPNTSGTIPARLVSNFSLSFNTSSPDAFDSAFPAVMRQSLPSTIPSATASPYSRLQ